MPNPKNVTTGVPPDPSTVPLLSRIWSGHLGSLQLPPAETTTVDEISVVIDAGELGRVRVYYRRHQ